MPRLPKSDLALQSQGKWVEYVPGLELLIASATAPEYQQEHRRVQRAVREQTETLKRRNGGQPLTVEQEQQVEELATELTRESAGRVLLRGWRGLEDDEGADVPYTVARSVAYMLDRAYEDLALFVLRVAASAHEYRMPVREEARGN